ncbi:4a-hydroxytetrahydrobiopterin dehydratase [Ideonella sp. DXS22W]|uniref:Putative pterin-4-alpha-carbinolamine dehydratase n=1 Tax=Pseudaquabacterium inlustre TaxID=2984192 RepID=A0ABU9CD44_9BURK
MSLPLAQQHCQPVSGAPLADAEIAPLLAQVPGWQRVTTASGQTAIEKRYAFADFHRTIGFVNAVAFVCNREDHHPDLAVSYGACTVRFNTHSVGGLSANDFICAAMIDALQPA